ncbi:MULTISPECIES: hypothetical protein [Streptomyces]|uniref:Uncharacterized protein n=2 Tax=Streptomyces rimosus subsp. rimosus TaxID=132474 RepID=L8EY38_STRR1|nr:MULTISPECIES: hypothetical protein [Streptomyces]KOG70552.1 hypothetical protein ADK78_28610 [Kitasatospora aureofaciens]MYT47333.1 hypothetical protein [Streptomyces sp. SID5471]KEF04663.1 hypothetical protein DF17_22510 [Streptomyces rimosus]KEF19919.1 hypothetical protein DF18_13860 [Streptomyces rimosus]KOT31378.1 hypothetical protein ADK84_30125 [Streptomyces sp. NRRL WC-3701]
MTARPTASQITDDQLDELYAELERAREALSARETASEPSDGAEPVRSAARPPEGPAGHAYLSTGCLHGEHGYCQGAHGLAGAKVPAKCKWCDAKCICPCHQSAGLPPKEAA